MEIDNGALQRLLRLTTRPQIVAGKPQDQVIATILRFGEDACSTTSLVRDGKTSLSRFAVPATGEGEIPVPDIHRMLGVLKYHGSTVKLSLDSGKLRVKSGSKQTSLLSDLGGLAFPHSTDTIGEWEQKSSLLAKQVDPVGIYTLRSGEKREAFLSWGVNATELYESLRCDAMNNQKLNRFTFELEIRNNDSSLMTTTTGDGLKGLTSDEWEVDGTNSTENHPYPNNREGDGFVAIFEGGIDSVLKEMDGLVTLSFIDFTAEKQGIRLVLDCGGSGWVYQASVLG